MKPGKWFLLLLLFTLLLAACQSNAAGDNPAAPNVTTPQIVVDPAAGPRGTQHVIALAGFKPNEGVHLAFILESSGETLHRLNGTVGAEGAGFVRITTEERDVPGRYRIQVLGDQGSSVIGTMTIE